MRSSLLSISAALLLLLPCFGGLAAAEVKKGFKDCLKFFYKRTPPSGLYGVDKQIVKEYKAICQRYKGEWRFATMYHQTHRTPLFSAYIMSPADGKRPEIPWMYEPQLASPSNSWEMQPFPTPVPKDVVKSQAVDEDYRGSGFTKGHLTPSSHQQEGGDRNATFTLTNIVPQREESNSGPWSMWEQKVLESFKKYCKGQMYVITGVIPYKSYHWINERVAVPEYIWSVHCCPKYSSKLPEHMKQFFPTYGAVGRNDPKSGEEIVPVKKGKGYDVREMSLETLERILNKRLNTNKKVNLFNGECLKP